MTQPGNTLLYLSRADIDHMVIPPAEVRTAIENLCRGRETGAVSNAPKSALRPDPQRLFMSTLSAAVDPPLMAVKSLGMNGANAANGLDTIGALITLFDADTGLPLAVMDADRITAVRTAGLSALAAAYLGPETPRVITFVGCGVQALAHLDAFADRDSLSAVRAIGRGTKNIDILLRRAGELGLDGQTFDAGPETFEGADIIVTTVPNLVDQKPFLDARWVDHGAFVAMVDLGRSWRSESLDQFDRIIIDDLVQERTMSEPMLPLDMVEGDLQDVVAGRLPRRQDPSHRIAFIFRGLAIADLAVAALVFARARAEGVGRQLPR